MSTKQQLVSVDPEVLHKSAKRLVEKFHQFTKHSPKMLRDSMMMAYCKAVDDIMQAMDAAKLENPIPLKEEAPVCLVDSNGNAM